ncbi:MAG: YezD family protein [Lachnospiraceae bacterium]|nr:YezD family protein [Lachnospiraceae bacterium]
MSGVKKEKIDYVKDVEPVIRKYLEEIKYGYITLVVQDGVIIQIEKNEKTRLR